MYRITFNGDFFFGTGADSRPSYTIISPKLQLEKNTAGSFSFTVYNQHPCYDVPKELVTYVEITSGSKVIFRGRVLSIEKGFHNEKKILCEGCLAYLMDSVQRQYDLNSYNGAELFKHLIKSHNAVVDIKRRFKVGRITVSDIDISTEYSDTEYQNTWEAVNSKLINVLGGRLNVRYEDDGTYIDYLAKSTDVSSQTIEFGKNLLDIVQSENADEIATAIIPAGKEINEQRMTVSGLDDTETDDICKKGDVVYSKKGVEKYGYIEKSVIFNNTALPTYLLKYAETYLKKALNMSTSVELTAVDLAAVNRDIESFSLGELVKVRSAPHGIEQEFEVTKLIINLTNPKLNKLILGECTGGITDMMSSGSSGGSFSGGMGGGVSYYAGTGLELLGTTFNHTNSITAGTVGAASNEVPVISYDSEGHIVSARTKKITFFDSYSATFSSPSTVWVVLHELGKYPSVTVIDNYGEVILCEIEYTNENTVTLRFSTATAGTVYLN